MIEALAQRKGLEFSINGQAALPECIYTDSNRLKQILLNLLSNAVKFTRSGHILLSVEAENTNSLKFSVIDTGIGIALENQAKLFTEFEMLGNQGENP